MRGKDSRPFLSDCFPDRMTEEEKQRMPLRDHFRPPLDDLRHWEGLLAGWPVMIVASLRRTLPPHYFAEPRVHLGSSADLPSQDVCEARVCDEERHSRLLGVVSIA